jgi:3-oxoacyl-[acyl-carrier protein] reductase
MKDEDWNNVLNLNLTSSFMITKHVIKKMLKNKKGKIINITSIVGHTGNVGQANYSASKAGLIGMSKSLALEYGRKNIKINCVSPGFIKSEMTDKISEEYKKIMEDKISLGRFGKPDDVANVVAFLSSELSDYITGETIHVNGGMYFS